MILSIQIYTKRLGSLTIKFLFLQMLSIIIDKPRILLFDEELQGL